MSADKPLILVVDDDVDWSDVLSVSLKKLGYRTHLVPDTKEATIAAIESALDAPAGVRAMAVRARQRVEGELSFESRVRRVERIYREMVGTTTALHPAYA